MVQEGAPPPSALFLKIEISYVNQESFLFYKGDCGCTANLVNSNVVRSVRFGGNWNNGANDGLSYINANNAPSNANANWGGDLYL